MIVILKQVTTCQVGWTLNDSDTKTGEDLTGRLNVTW